MSPEPRVKLEGSWPMAITLCVFAISLAACIVGSLWVIGQAGRS